MYRAATTLLIALLASACGGATPPRTSPTLTSGVVGGRVALPETQQAGSPRMTVHIVGTGISTTVGSTGEFVLPNVPAGPLELLFTGHGLSSGVAAGEIAGGETLTLTLRLDGTRAVIDAVARVRGTDATLEGVIDPPLDTLPPNTIIVAGRSVTLPPGGGAALTPGTRVRVTGSVNGPGIIARTIDVL